MDISYTNVITEVFSQVDTLLNGLIGHIYQFIIQTFRWPFIICLQLYIILIGYGVMQGWFKLAWGDLSRAIIKLVVVAALISSWPFFQKYIVSFFISGVNDIASRLVLSAFSSTAAAVSKPISEIGQQMLVEIARVGLWVWRMASFGSYLPILLGFILWVMGLGVIVVGIFQILIAKILLTLLLATSPFFVILILFGTTQGMTWRWLQLCATQGLSLIMVSMVMGLCVYLLHQVFDKLYQAHASGIEMLNIIPVVLVSALSMALIFKAVGVARFIGSSIMPRQGGGGITIMGKSLQLGKTLMKGGGG